MTIIRWDPFRSMQQVQESIDRLFDVQDVKSHFAEEETAQSEWLPNVNIYEDDEKIVIKADLPEVDERDINLKFDNAMLILRGERKFDTETDIGNYRRIECSYGAFLRKFAVPSSVDVNAIQAKLNEGVLKITLPKIKP